MADHNRVNVQKKNSDGEICVIIKTSALKLKEK